MEHRDTAELPNADALAPALPSQSGARFPVVGLGASAGGLEALQSFFDHTPPDTGMAFVVILHLSPEYQSQAAALLQRHTTMPVQQVTDTVRIVPNQVYVIPPAQHLELADGHLHVAPPATEQERHASIDHFFRTLADTLDSHALAVILSGTGSDGMIGITRIKECGGAIFVQDPDEAAFGSMPKNAISTGLVDGVLPVAGIPECLATYCRRITHSVVVPDEAASPPQVDGAVLQEILTEVRLRTSHDFSLYKLPTVLRRIGRRMHVLGISDVAAYLETLRSRSDEVHALLQDLLISVTNFFRDPTVWAALQAILPQLFAGKGPADQLRVWVPACATGEEAYSVALVLLEHALNQDHPPAIQVFATDIDEQAIGKARRAVYPETIAGDVTPERLRRFFVREQGRYRVKQELRELVLFATHNMLRDPPFTKLDLITCRNLLIYLNRPAQEQVGRIFQFSLRPGGFLLLGNAESLDHAHEHFSVVAPSQHLYQRAGRSTIPPALQVHTPGLIPVRVREPGELAELLGSMAGDLHQRLLLAHTPPSALLNADYEVVHLSRGASRFLQLEGKLSTNLLRLAHPDLRLELQTALFQAGQQGLRVERRGIPVTIDETMRLVDLTVEPVVDTAVPKGYLLVLFRDGGPATPDRLPDVPEYDGLLNELRAELERAREQLRITAEQYATSTEEYKAANEELQAINEELRASSEELETSKEELQAVNEELSTVNQELKTRVDEVTHANNDLQNLIAATAIATLFLDRELRITRYTPRTETIFNLIPSDLHRPLCHITHSLQDAQLETDAREVLQTLTLVERELVSTTGQWYLVQLRPYRTTDDRIAGVVVTFVDITARKHAEIALRESETRFRAVADLVPDLLWSNDSTGRSDWYNQRWYQYTGQAPEQALGYGWADVIHPDDRETSLRDFRNAIERGESVRQEHRICGADGVYRWFLVRAHPLTDDAEQIVRWYGAATDIHDERMARHAAEDAVRAREQFLSIASHELRSPLTALLGYAYMLQRHAQTTAASDTLLQRQADTITRQAKRLNGLIEQLLDVSRLQRGQFVVERQVVDLGALVNQAVNEFRMTLPDDGPHTIRLLQLDEPVEVLADPARLEEVVQNLLTNAVKYSPQGGNVDVRVTTTATEATIEVADQGIGIPANAQERLFEPFYRASNVSPQSSGFGIGLYVVRELVQRHGGWIEVESTEGEGSCFQVVLPRHHSGTAAGDGA